VCRKERSDISRIIDLTLTLHHGMRGVAFETASTVEEQGWNTRTLHLYSHGGTHMDAPLHFGVTSETIDAISLDRCMGPAWVVDLPGLAPRALITVAHLGAVESEARPGESVLLRTGWSRYVADPARYRDGLPRVSPELAAWCVEKRIRILGVEPPSVADVNDLAEVTAIHRTLLGGGVVIVEGLANLEAIMQPRVFLVALPLKIGGGDGAPCRAFAVDGGPLTIGAELLPDLAR
jgi:kynurenine formamidase